MKIKPIGVLDDQTDVTESHENNISPFYPHSEGAALVSCRAVEAQQIILETSDDGIAWDIVVQKGILPEAVDTTYILDYGKMGAFMRVRVVNLTAGQAEVFLIG